MGDSNRVRWYPNAVKCFLEACIVEITKRGRRGSSLYPESWEAVKKTLKETCNFVVDQKKMRNEYDYLKGKYTGWLYLTKKTGNLYNEATNTFNMTNEEWEAFYKGHPNAKTLRNSPLLFPDLCVALFDGAAANGDNQWTPSSNYPRPRDSSTSLTSPNFQLVNVENLDETSDSAGLRNPPTPGSQSGTSNPRRDREMPKGPNSNFEEGRPKKKVKSSMKMSQLEEDMASALKVIIKNNDGPSHDECLAKLNEFEWPKNCPFYVAALGIFCEKPSYRKGWMSLPKEDVGLVKSWIASVGGKLGYHV